MDISDGSSSVVTGATGSSGAGGDTSVTAGLWDEDGFGSVAA